MLVWRGHKARVRSLAFSPDGTRIVTTAGDSKFVWLWDATSGKLVAKLTGDFFAPVRSAVFFPDGKHVAGVLEPEDARVWNSGIRIWDVEARKLVVHLTGPSFRPDSLAVSPDGSRLLAAVSTGVAEWDDPTTPVPDTPARPPRRTHTVYHRGTTLLAFSPLGKYFCVGEYFMHLHDPVTFKEVREFRDSVSASVLGASVTAFAFSPDECRLVVGLGHRAAVWNLADPVAKPVPIAGHGNYVKGVGFLPDGRTVLTAGMDGTARIWDTVSGAELRSFDWGIGKLRVAAVSPDGTRCAAGGDTGQLIVWDVDG